MPPERNGPKKWRVRFLANLSPFLDENLPRTGDLTRASIALLGPVLDWLDAT
jgi:hypothetical protein